MTVEQTRGGFTIYPMSREELQRRPKLVEALRRAEEQQRGQPVLTLEEAVARGQAELRAKSWLRRRLRRWLQLTGLWVGRMGDRL